MALILTFQMLKTFSMPSIAFLPVGAWQEIKFAHYRNWNLLSNKEQTQNDVQVGQKTLQKE